MYGFLSYSDLLEFLWKSKEKNILLTFHSIGDRDGVASAVGLSQLFPKSVIMAPDYITNNAKKMLQDAAYDIEIDSVFPEGIDLVIVSDANRFEIMGRFEEKLMNFSGEVLFIDHHALPEQPEYGNKIRVFNSEEYNSASSIVCDVLKSSGTRISKQTAQILISGIVSDSADFQNSNPLMFRQISELLEVSGKIYTEIVSTEHMAASPDIRSRIMKDLFSARIDECGRYLLLYGEAKFQANTSAEIALRIGADASVFWSLKEKEVTISARLRSPLDKELSINLGRIMNEVGDIINGTGGGHPCAAGAYGKKIANLDAAVQNIIDHIKNGFTSEKK